MPTVWVGNDGGRHPERKLHIPLLDSGEEKFSEPSRNNSAWATRAKDVEKLPKRDAEGQPLKTSIFGKRWKSK